MKKLVLLMSFILSSTLLASEGLDLKKARNIMCRSDAIGSLYLVNLKSNAQVFTTRQIPVKIENVTKKTLTYIYRENENYRFTLALENRVQHDDYVSYEGFLINGDIQSPVECTID